MTNTVCLGCGKVGPWSRAHGTRALRCGPCAARYARFRGGHYRRTARIPLPPLARCEECGGRGDPTWDHIVPISRGGRSTPSNLRVLCRRCNSRKGNR